MGRPERFLNLFVHGRLQSPIMWDVIVIGTYFFISLLLLYFPLLPDLKILIQFKEKINATVKVQQNYLDALLRDDVEISKKTQKSIIKRIAYIEYQADEYYKELVKFYITKGQKANPENF